MLEKMWNKGNTHSLLLRMQTYTTTLEISMVVSHKIGNQPTSGSSNTWNILKRCSSYYKSICLAMIIEALFVISKTWKQPRCPSTKEQIKKIWYIYTIEYYSMVKNNTKKHYNLKFECKWMKLEITILSEVTQTHKDEHSMYSLISGYQV